MKNEKCKMLRKMTKEEKINLQFTMFYSRSHRLPEPCSAPVCVAVATGRRQTGTRFLEYKIKVISLIFLLTALPLQAYEWDISAKKEIPIILSAVALNVSAYMYQQSIDPLPLQEIEQLDAHDINSFDRCAASWYNSDFDKASDFTLLAGALIPVFVSLDKNDTKFVEDMLIYGEILALQAGVAAWSKALVKRERPYMYNEDVLEQKKTDEDAQFSFYSLHTSTAFSAATYGSYLYEKKGGDNPTFFWAANLTLASLTAGLRIASGEHFPTDVIVGALVGSSLGYFFAKYRMNEPIYVTPHKLAVTIHF